MFRCADRLWEIEAREGPVSRRRTRRAGVTHFCERRLSIRTREGGFRGVASIVHLDRSTADAPSQAAGEGVFHEFHTAAVWAFRLGSAPARLSAGGTREPAVARHRNGGDDLFPWLPTDQLVTNPQTHQREVYLATEAINPNNPKSPGLSNEGKVVTGIDRAPRRSDARPLMRGRTFPRESPVPLRTGRLLRRLAGPQPDNRHRLQPPAPGSSRAFGRRGHSRMDGCRAST